MLDVHTICTLQVSWIELKWTHLNWTKLKCSLHLWPLWLKTQWYFFRCIFSLLVICWAILTAGLVISQHPLTDWFYFLHRVHSHPPTLIMSFHNASSHWFLLTILPLLVPLKAGLLQKRYSTLMRGRMKRLRGRTIWLCNCGSSFPTLLSLYLWSWLHHLNKNHWRI